LLGAIDHALTRAAVEVERAFLAELGSGCSLPVGAHATDATLTVFLATADRARHSIETIELPTDHGTALRRSAELARSIHDQLQ
jgi:hydroxymethylbilane synthase